MNSVDPGVMALSVDLLGERGRSATVTARARLTFTMRGRAGVALQSFLSGSDEAEPY
jgi:hypothetical protein